MLSPHPLFMIRHGETDWNAEGRYQGQRDIPLNDHGRAQAARNGMVLATRLADEGLGVEDVAFVSSPLERARETMALVRQGLSLPETGARFDDRLREVHYGTWEGLTVPDLRRIDPDGLKRRKADPYHFTPPGGESYAALAERVFAAMAEFDRPTVIVAHGGVTRVLRVAYLGVPTATAVQFDVPQARFFRFWGRDAEIL